MLTNKEIGELMDRAYSRGFAEYSGERFVALLEASGHGVSERCEDASAPADDDTPKRERVYVFAGDVGDGLIGLYTDVLLVDGKEFANIQSSVTSQYVSRVAWRSPEEARKALLEKAQEEYEALNSETKAAAELVIKIANGQIRIDER